MKKLLVKGLPARMVVYDYQAIGGPMRAYCAEMSAQAWLEAHGIAPLSMLSIKEVVEWERSPTDRAADVELGVGHHTAKLRDLILTDLPVSSGGRASAGDTLEMELDGQWTHFDHSCSSWTGFSVTHGPGEHPGFTLNPDFVRAWVHQGKVRLRLHTQRIGQQAA